MPNTVTNGPGNVCTVVFDGATAWNPGMQYRVLSFEFLPAANNDIITVRNGSATGPIVFKQRVSSTTGVADQRKGYEYGYGGTGMNITPYVVGNQVSASATLVMKFA
jgi:hypothetical protein